MAATKKKETISKKTRELALQYVERLKEPYPDAMCTLDYGQPHELLISTRLAAQCTDARVNMITPALYEKYPSIDAFAQADVQDVEEIIRPCGFFHTKAKDIVGMAQMIRDEFGGRVPDTIEQLTTLPGIGRKTANLVVGDVYGKPSVVVDTHCIRLTNRMGLVSTKDPVKIEMRLRELLPPDESSNFCHRLVLHGRAVCPARKPNCAACNLSDICPKIGVEG